MKASLKTLWISFLSTIIKILAQTLTTEGFSDINTIKVAFTEVPIEYFAINFFIFVALTVLFILINQQIPAYKLLKGFIYTIMVSFVWTALRFQPNVLENFAKYAYGVATFFIPMIIYGALLGYLSTDRQKNLNFLKTCFYIWQFLLDGFYFTLFILSLCHQQNRKYLIILFGYCLPL